MKSKIPGLLVVGLLGAAAAPSAGAVVWSLDSSSCVQNAANANNYGNSYACGGSPAVLVRGYSTTGAGESIAIANVDRTTTGIGVRSTTEGLAATSPDSLLDNSGATDLLLLSFESSVTLRNVDLGQWHTDADLTLLYFTGAIDPLAIGALTGLTAGALIANGWALAGNYGNVGVEGDTSVNAGSASSRWWLLAAYDSIMAGSNVSANGQPLGAGDDFLGLLSVSDEINTVPEPGTLALLGLGLAGLGLSRRRSSRTDRP